MFPAAGIWLPLPSSAHELGSKFRWQKAKRTQVLERSVLNSLSMPWNVCNENNPATSRPRKSRVPALAAIEEDACAHSIHKDTRKEPIIAFFIVLASSRLNPEAAVHMVRHP